LLKQAKPELVRPNEAIIYPETIRRPRARIFNGESFQELAESKPDFSFLKICPSSPSTAETIEENAALNFKPRFVAVAETHAWSWQNRSVRRKSV